MRPGQGQRRGGRRNDNRHGGRTEGHHRSGQQGQGGQQRTATSLRNQIFDSNGPDMRVRGNAFQVHEKYQALAKDALSSGDRVLAENYLQHAEHYYRIIEAINEATATEQRVRQASWESQPQPVSYEGQSVEPSQDAPPPVQEGGYSNQQESQYQSQPQGNGQQHYRRREHPRDGQRDRYRDGRNQQRYGNSEYRGSDGRGNDMGGDRQGYDSQQRHAEVQPHHQTQQPSGASQDPLYDGVDEDVNEGQDTQTAVGGRR